MDSIMKIEIDDDILDTTTNCNDDFSCLLGDLELLCEVESCVSDTIHFVKCLETTHCYYKVPFGDGHVCTCPTRMEIYNRYKV